MASNSFLNPKCTVLDSPLGGKGIFATAPLQKKELIAIWGGKIYTSKELKKYGTKYPEMITHPVEIYKDYYLGPVNPKKLEATDRFNHSCNPNAGIRGQIILEARRDIKKGEEITYDYETSDISFFGKPMICHCNAKNCRKTINGHSWKEKYFQKRNKKYLATYILDLIKTSERNR